MNFFFTSDEHYAHKNVIEYCKRPFQNLHEMDRILIENHNSVVTEKDTVVHLGDFTLKNKTFAQSIIEQLKGNHIFIMGSHDKWLDNNEYIFRRRFNDKLVVGCHYAMRVWEESHYNSIQLYGHSHGTLPPQGNQMDVGVDCNDFKPVALDFILDKFK